MREPRRGIKTTEFFIALAGFMLGAFMIYTGLGAPYAGALIVATSIYSYVTGRARAKSAAASDVSPNPPKRII